MGHGEATEGMPRRRQRRVLLPAVSKGVRCTRQATERSFSQKLKKPRV